MRRWVIYVENIINKVIEIDNLTLKMKENTDNRIKEEKNRIIQEICVIREEGMKKTKKEAEEKYSVILESAQKEVEKINQESLKEYNRLEKIYERHSSKLAEEVFKKIL